MKKLMFLLAMLPAISYCQDSTVVGFKDDTQDVTVTPKSKKEINPHTWYRPIVSKNDIVIYALQVVSGGASGFGDMLVYHKHTFMRMYPNANFNWWIPEYSQGRRGWVMTRDGIHMVRAVEHVSNYVSIGFSFSDFKGLSTKQCLLLGAKRAVISAIVNRLAFRVVYNGWFSDKIERQKAGLN